MAPGPAKPHGLSGAARARPKSSRPSLGDWDIFLAAPTEAIGLSWAWASVIGLFAVLGQCYRLFTHYLVSSIALTGSSF